MKRLGGKRALALVLAWSLLLSLLPMTALAEAGGRFCLVAEAQGKLVIAPEYVEYPAGATLLEALKGSGHTFEGIDDWQITAIDGVVGNYNRYDEDNEFSLEKAAAEVSFFRFSENTASGPSQALQALMTAMADYLLEPSDVRAAAKTAYDAAWNGFVGADEELAQELADGLTAAMEDYKDAQDTLCEVNFDIEGDGLSIRAENAYGKVYTDDDGDKCLKLPVGTYAFTVSDGTGRGLSGELAVEDTVTVTAQLPGEEDWMNTDTLKLSGGYGEEAFAQEIFEMTGWEDRRASAFVRDAFTGTVYLYAEHTFETGQAPQLTAVFTDSSGEEQAQPLVFRSCKSGPAKALKTGARGNTVIFRVSREAEGGFTQYMDYTVELCRVPSLENLSVTDGNGAAQTATQAFSPYVTEYLYKVVDLVTEVIVTPVPFDESYTVSVNGEEASGGVAVAVDGETPITVTVEGGGYSTDYLLTVRPGEGKTITFGTNTDVEMEVVNNNGEVLSYTKIRETDTYYRYLYTLVPGEAYSYVAKKGHCYSAGSFTMEQDAGTIIQVDMQMEDWLDDLAFASEAMAARKGNLPLDSAFSPDDHEYTVSVPDTNAPVYVWATDAGGASIRALYRGISSGSTYDGVERSVDLPSGEQKGTQIKYVLMDRSGYGNRVVIRLTKEGESEDRNITYYQDYVVDLQRELSLESLAVQCAGQSVALMRENGTVGYKAAVTDYTVRVPAAAAQLQIIPTAYAALADNTRYGDDTVGYQVEIGGETAGSGLAFTVPLTGDSTTEQVEVVLTNQFAPDARTVYTVTVQKAAPIHTSFVFDPAGALLCMHEPLSGNRVWPNEQGAYELSEGYSYDYTLTLDGWVGRGGTITVTRNDAGEVVLRLDGDDIPVQIGDVGQSGYAQVEMTLAKAPANPDLDPDITAEWPDFRGNSANNAVTDAAIPITDESGTLYWANQLGSGTDQGATGCPILVNGDLITYAGDQIYRVDTVSGRILAQGTMDHTSSFSITPPTYYRGMIFMALSDGTVQAFDANTLESLWIYEDALKGQPNSPMTVKDGYLYTGFWLSEVGDANYVCLSVTDEDPSRPDEPKQATWYHTQKGGFYWAGAYVGDGFLAVGTDDGKSTCTSQTSSLLLLDPLTGKVLDSLKGLNGDIRCTVAYDSVTDALYFTSKGGTFYSVQVQAGSDGGYAFTGLRRVALTNGTDGSTPMSTSSPVVHNGRAYVGVSGEGQFSAYSGHNLTVIDLQANRIAYRVETQGYPQTSGLLTTAYEAQTGAVYVYFFDNYTPGKLRVLRDKPGQTAPDYVTEERYTYKGSTYTVQTPYVLFTPVGDQAEYVICSPIADEYGTVYFKNDTANLMAFGPTVEKLEVVSGPDRTVYAAGDAFDPTGMRVEAVYSNGCRRDVTEHLTWPRLKEGDTAVTLTFPYVMYHDQEGQAGVTTGKPTVTLPVTVGRGAETVLTATAQGDTVTVTFDGASSTHWTVVAAAYSQDGRMEALVSVQASGSVTQQLTLPGAETAWQVRVFVLDRDHAPVMESRDVE